MGAKDLTPNNDLSYLQTPTYQIVVRLARTHTGPTRGGPTQLSAQLRR